MNLEELLNLISSTSVDDTKLFFITRALKPNMKRKARAHEKYLYHVFQVDNDEDLREYIYETSISQLKSIVDKNYEMVRKFNLVGIEESSSFHRTSGYCDS